MKAGNEPGPGSETILSYRGNSLDNTLDSLLELAEYKLQQQTSTEKSIRRKLFKILVETLQNTYLHLDNPTSTEEFPIDFSISKDNYTYTVYAGNPIRKSKVEALRARIDRLNAMSLSELKEYYRRKLSAGQVSHHGGAGLGFVDIIRRSGKKIAYKFKPVNKDYSYFSLQVKVST